MILIDSRKARLYSLLHHYEAGGYSMSKKAKQIFPFANESDSLGIGGLTIENRTDRISLYGSIDITRDKEGLVHAERLKMLFDDIVAAMKADHLPDRISIKAEEEIANPFAE
jgi:hypothetical protein